MRRKRYSGHVYNLDTMDGWYVANSIIAQNCNLRHHDALGYYPATHARMEGKQMEAAGAWEADAGKGLRNQRDKPSGRFRTFEGESREAATAFQEGRIHDAVDLLGSARALATEPGHRTTLDTLQRSVGRVQHVIPELTKGFIRGDSIAHGDKTGFHEGSAGDGHIYLRTRDGVRHRVPAKELRATSDTENEDLYREETDPGLPGSEDEAAAKSKASAR